MKHVMSIKIRDSQVDSKNQLRPTELLGLFGDVATSQLESENIDYINMRNFNGEAFIVSTMTVEILEAINRNDNVDVYTWYTKSKGAIFPRSYQVIKNGNILAKGFAKWALYDVKNKKFILQKDFDKFKRFEEHDINMDIREKIKINDDDLIKVGTEKIFYDLIDVNLHLNNSKYANLLARYIPNVEQKTITSLNLNFKNEAKYCDNIEIYMKKINNIEEIDKRADEIYYFKTMVGENINVRATIGTKK